MTTRVENNVKVIKAEDGKVLRRIADGFIFGEEVYLGYMYFINNEKLDTPIMATSEMFEEVDIPDYMKSKLEGRDK